jgi:hypothetical protein
VTDLREKEGQTEEKESDGWERKNMTDGEKESDRRE